MPFLSNIATAQKSQMLAAWLLSVLHSWTDLEVKGYDVSCQLSVVSQDLLGINEDLAEKFENLLLEDRWDFTGNSK